MDFSLILPLMDTGIRSLGEEALNVYFNAGSILLHLREAVTLVCGSKLLENKMRNFSSFLFTQKRNFSLGIKEPKPAKYHIIFSSGFFV